MSYMMEDRPSSALVSEKLQARRITSEYIHFGIAQKQEFSLLIDVLV